ncbi:uncharacterized protein METZ01_LOCUS400230, partial [marine metagenome]
MRNVVIFLVLLLFAVPARAEVVDGTGVICTDPKNVKDRVYFFYGGKVHEVYMGAYELVYVMKLIKYEFSDSVISWSMPIRGTTWEYRRQVDINTSVLLMENINHAPNAVNVTVSYDCL